MIATSFDESNDTLSKPADMTHDQCDPLSIWRGTMPIDQAHLCPVVISCWKMTKEELEEVNRTGRVWLYVMGHTMPPVILNGCKPFAQPTVTDQGQHGESTT